MNKMIAAAAATALLVVSATPAGAHGRWHRHHNDVDAVEIVAGAVLVGGIAAIGNGNREKQDAAVESCSREAESRLDGRVTDIVGVTKRKGYYTVEGNVESGAGFSCTIRNGSLYSFRSARDEA